MNWTNEFKNRMHDFENQFNEKNSISLSIKIRITSGCFHREHSPEAYKIIDNEIKKLDALNEKVAFIEHESGPEILVYLAVTAATIQLSASLIDLIKAIIEARSKGIEKGDRPHDDLQIIVRGFNKHGELKDETVCKINHLEKIDKKTIKTVIESSINASLKQK